MGVFEERASHTPGMHWQHEQYIGPAYDPSRDLSPNLPSCDSSMGDADPSVSSGSSCSTPSNNNHQSCGSDTCRPPPPALNQPPPPPGELCRPHSSFEHHIPKLEPLQTPGTPPTPPPSCAEDGSGAVCAGCGMRITDRFYLQAVDRRWHASCLQCCQCRNTLDGEITCFSRDGNIYCKKDYYRLFGMKRCARCQATIISSELVMRARDLVFHVHCFSCAVCNSPLTKGDHFGMRDGAVLCRLHFEMPVTEPLPPGMFPPGMHHYPPPFPSPEFHHQIPPPTPVESIGKVPFFNGAPTTPRQKGRPRKRKPKDLEGMTANLELFFLDLNSDYLDMSFGRSPGTPGMHGSNQRTKRMRTSFKHHQLRTMKSYFAINHNPDAKDLKQLSQKTGLPKRVLQVWFQNARAKWRRMMLKQEGKSGDKCSGSESMSDLDLYPHGPGSMASSIQSMAPHSPPFILPPGSPSSLDCS
ncbi:LIM/homeobox protein Lhx9-like isoform X2 [Tribolium madens]|uniref:LIM/homeobox protein Lhx9-like isoform X2 n=1 Tax=Tribolium madens TaxID=41895 RepID=UPI001CF72ABD|nr:LIM/homeobox protein Lhx9-like isoform X2 [Tribolium madens]